MKVIVASMAKLVAKFWWIECFVPGGTLIILVILFARMWAPALSRTLAALIPIGLIRLRPAHSNEHSTGGEFCWTR
jgi:hypothetical protein